MLYDNNLKKKLCEEVCFNGKSTIITAKDYSIPLKTFEKWITAFNKDSHCFDSIDDSHNPHFFFSSDSDLIYDDMSNVELKNILLKKDIEIARLKKGYAVKGGGTEKKVFITFSKKNTK